MQDYDKNKKPIVKATPTASPIKNGSQNLAPVVKTPVSKSAFGSSIMPKNSVSQSSSAKLQSASRLPGRASLKDTPSITFE